MLGPPLIAGNWKMNLLRADAEALVDRLREELGSSGCQIVLFPPFPLLPRVADRLEEDSRIAVGGQDLHPEERGAHTGDVSGQQLLDAGGSWVLCGHSERRADHGESDVLVGRKVEAARRSGLRPILCIGETLEERERTQTENVLKRQLDGGGIDAASIETNGPAEGLVIAYEPVWAIGTGQSATPEIAQETHAFLRAELRLRVGTEDAERLPLLYGGSVKPANCKELIALPDVDGFLIGGASLDPRPFLDIIHRCGSLGRSEESR